MCCVERIHSTEHIADEVRTRDLEELAGKQQKHAANTMNVCEYDRTKMTPKSARMTPKRAKRSPSQNDTKKCQNDTGSPVFLLALPLPSPDRLLNVLVLD